MRRGVNGGGEEQIERNKAKLLRAKEYSRNRDRGETDQGTRQMGRKKKQREIENEKVCRGGCVFSLLL